MIRGHSLGCALASAGPLQIGHVTCGRAIKLSQNLRSTGAWKRRLIAIKKNPKPGYARLGLLEVHCSKLGF